MEESSFLCALDMPETEILGPLSRFKIEGWIFSPAGVAIDAVTLDVNGERIATSYPRPRPDVRDYYPQFTNAEGSGFETRVLDLRLRKPSALDIGVFARVGGSEREVARRTLRLRWSDPETQLFGLGAPGPFRRPQDFDAARLPRFESARPTFLLGPESSLDAARAMLQRQGHAVLPGDAFADLLRAIVELYDTYAYYRENFFRHFEEVIDGFAIGKFDVYEMLGAVANAFHERYVSGADAAFAMPGKPGYLPVPLLALLYPQARFVHVEGPTVERILDRFATIRERAAQPPAEEPEDDRRYENSVWGRAYGKLWQVATQGIPAKQCEAATLQSLAQTLPRGERPASMPVARQDDDFPLVAYPQPRPVFVLGAGRSGTSAMVGAMRAAGIEGAHEGHVFPMLSAMLGKVSKAIGRSNARLACRSAADSTLRQCYGGDRPGTWLAKTPDHPMIGCVELIKTVYPHARFIMMRRHPISFTESRRRKFGETPTSAMNEWVKCIDMWREQRARLAPSDYVESDAGELRSPQMQQRLCEFLELDATARKPFTDYLLTQRPELTRTSRDALDKFAGLPDARRFALRDTFYGMLDALGEFIEDVDWPPEQKEAILRSLGSRPEELGYVVRRPPRYLQMLLAEWAAAIENYRHIAEQNQLAAATWREELDRLAATGRNQVRSG
jgi:hypothetical protein